MNIPITMKMPSLSGLRKKPQGILRNQGIRGFFGFESSFQNQRNHRVYFDSVKYLVVAFSSHLKRAFSVLLEYSLRIISGT
jgi:hypothetical protein